MKWKIKQGIFTFSFIHHFWVLELVFSIGNPATEFNKISENETEQREQKCRVRARGGWKREGGGDRRIRENTERNRNNIRKHLWTWHKTNLESQRYEVCLKKVHVQAGMGDKLFLRNVIQKNMHGYFTRGAYGHWEIFWMHRSLQPYQSKYVLR